MVDYGFYDDDGKFVTVSRSKTAQAPRDSVAQPLDWVAPVSREDRAQEAIHRVSVGARPYAQIGIGSSELSSEGAARGRLGAPSSPEFLGASERRIP